ncbi:MAG: ATP synthase F1 subunit delta [Bacteroidetes bacterium]|nr:ATP synthase F1 subunit delta [Bacteroidota bacterium]MBS1931616.1 ATP synthase F1 subunit delta [Bacteroidota bacterium]
MPNPRLAERYAKSLIDLSIDKGQLENVFADMQWLQWVCKESREFVNVLRSPIIKSDKKKKVIDAIIKDKVNALTDAFAHLLIQKGRESNLPEICTAFVNQYKEYKHIYTVKLTTATPMSEELKSAIVKQIQSVSEMQNIELETAVKPELIGGFVLQAGDKLVDASISYDLKEVARQFENNDFVYKIR